MDSVLYLIFTIAYAVLLFWGIALIAKRRRMLVSDLALLVVAALVYDNAVLAVGVLAGEGAGLETANALRFWFHAFVTPMLVLVGWHVMVRAGVRWAASAWVGAAAVVLTIALIAWELVIGTTRMDLVARNEYGAISYSNENAPDGPPIMALIVVAVLLLSGILTWVKAGWPWLAVAAAVMVTGTSIPWSLPSGAVTNLFELLLLLGVVATIAFQDRTEPAPVPEV